MKISELVPVTIGLSATPPSQATFSTPILMVDHADVPLDKRYRTVTRSSYATALTAATKQLAWCTELWGQYQNSDIAYIGRYIGTASNSYMVFPNATTDIAVWAGLLATAKIKIIEGAANEDIATDYTAVTSMADVAAATQTGLQLGTITANYTCVLDAFNRPIIVSDLPGTAADAVSAGTPDTGVDLTLPEYFGSEFSVGGLDVETPGAALAIILEKDNTPFIINEVGLVLAEKVAFSTAVNAMDKILLLRTNDTDVKDSSSSADMGYLIHALLHQKTHVVYTEHATQYPDAAICGEIFPRKEATTNLALTPLLGLSQSGLDVDGTTVIPLTSDERIALTAKGVDFLIKPSSVVHLKNGLASGGNEIRIMVAKSFMAAKISESVYGFMIANSVVTFSDEDILVIKGIVTYWADELVDRKVLDAGYEITMPSAADFTAAAKATHVMDLEDISDMETQRAVNEVSISLTWNI